MDAITIIDEFLDRKKTTQTALAESIGVTPRYLSAVLHGDHRPSHDFLSALVEKLIAGKVLKRSEAFDFATALAGKRSRKPRDRRVRSRRRPAALSRS